MTLLIKVASETPAQCQKLIDERQMYYDDLLEYRAYGDPDVQKSIARSGKYLDQLRHLGNFYIQPPEKDPEQFARSFNKVIKAVSDPKLDHLVTAWDDTQVCHGAKMPPISLTATERRALIRHDGDKVRIIDKGAPKEVRVVVEKDPIPFTPGKPWRTYQKFFPLFAAFTPYLCGPTNDSPTQSRIGRILQPIVGLLLFPLLLAGSILYFLIGGPGWHDPEKQGYEQVGTEPPPPSYAEVEKMKLAVEEKPILE